MRTTHAIQWQGGTVPKQPDHEEVRILAPARQDCEITGLLRTFGCTSPDELARQIDDYELYEVYPALEGPPIKRTF